MKSPFKFLEAYDLNDKDVFFGRDQETEDLYKTVFMTPLLLVYGLSGTGKTSLIRCGLANCFDGPDWYPFYIRREDNLITSIKETLSTALNGRDKGSITKNIRFLYRYYLRPIYLIFDQFEELFIMGTPEEKKEFISIISDILEEELPCKILLVMREEYLGQLYPFEKEIPTIFDHRVRVEPMGIQKVKEVMTSSFEKFNISLEGDEDKRMEEMIFNISEGKSGIQLPYLQVYLDMLYREDYIRTYGKEEKETLKPITLTQKEIQNFGQIDNVLDRFLDEQVRAIPWRLQKHHPSLNMDTVRQILDGFVTEDGTKRPVQFSRVEEVITFSEVARKYFPDTEGPLLTATIEALDQARLLRVQDAQIELAHDSLAALIDQRRSDAQRRKNEVRKRIMQAYAEKEQTGEYLSRKQLNAYEEILPLLNLEPHLDAFIQESHQDADDKEAAELAEQEEKLRLTEEKLAAEKKSRSRQRIALIVTALAFVASMALGLWGNNRRIQAEIAEKRADSLRVEADTALGIAERSLDKFKKGQAARVNSIIDDLLKRAGQLSEYPEAVRSKYEEALDTLTNYQENEILQDRIPEIQAKLTP
ncbi:MAG: ATP-binding protein [Bacteroidota bacterium]